MNTIFPPSGLYCDDFAIRFPRAWLLAFLEIQIDQEGLATMATMVDEAAQAVPVAEDAAAQAESAPRESHAEPTSSEKPGAATENNKGTEGEVGARELSRDYTGRLQIDSNDSNIDSVVSNGSKYCRNSFSRYSGGHRSRIRSTEA